MDIPWQSLKAEVLQALVEEFVSREGTDYGLFEVPFERKVKTVFDLLKSGKIKIVFDPETETCDLRELKK